MKLQRIQSRHLRRKQKQEAYKAVLKKRMALQTTLILMRKKLAKAVKDDYARMYQVNGVAEAQIR
ncbi:MAG: hypothetical protein ACLU80_04300 [Dorea sp.]